MEQVKYGIYVSRNIIDKIHVHDISWIIARLMEIFFALLAFCAGNSPVTGEFPVQRPVTRSFLCFLWFAPEPTVEQTMETPVIWDAMVLIMTSL